jgi:serine/threonine protein phosphatase PrpC
MSSDGRTHWGSIAVGTPTADFEPRPADTLSYRPDTVADGWSTGDLTVRLASVRGYAHRYAGLPRQDDAAVVHHPASGAVVFAVADGVSAAPLAHLGATAACRAAVSAVTGALDAGSAVDWPTVMEHAAWQVVEQAAVVLRLERPDPGRAEEEMATALIAGLVRSAGATVDLVVARVGDSAAWVLRDGRFRPLFESKTAAVAETAVTALPRVPELDVRDGPLRPGEVLLVGTDGFGDPLGDGTGHVGAHFAVRLTRPRPPLAFAHDLDFSRETFDDDRTLLAVWPRHMS